MENARTTAESWELDKPREFWLEDYCAQLALLITMVLELISSWSLKLG